MITATPRGEILREGFTLVEVVLAIGLIGFSLLAVVGLMASAHRSSKEASERTAMALILQSSRGVLSGMPFTNLTNLLGAGSGVWMGFDREGRYLGRTNSSNAVDTNAAYRVQVRPVSTAALTNYSQLRALISISSPPPVFNQTSTFPVSFVRYGSDY
ncbi:MAG: hypothetical protein WCH98_02535 [Verrucomicrobiota bacterium]